MGINRTKRVKQSIFVFISLPCPIFRHLDIFKIRTIEFSKISILVVLTAYEKLNSEHILTRCCDFKLSIFSKDY